MIPGQADVEERGPGGGLAALGDRAGEGVPDALLHGGGR